MATQTTQKGFSVIEVVIGVAVIGLITVLGFTAYNRFTADDAKTETTQTENKEALTAPEIQSAADLNEANKVLDSAELDADSAALDKELEEF